jgi:hypothetical protein
MLEYLTIPAHSQTGRRKEASIIKHELCLDILVVTYCAKRCFKFLNA